MKIAVIGAGQGGLYAATKLSQHGFDVSIYEKSSRSEIGIDWFDGVSTRFFDDLGIDVPPDSFKGNAVSFVAPFSEKPLYLWSPAESMDWSVNRHTFTKQLIEQAVKSGVKISFDTEVTSLAMNGSTVCGIYVGTEKISADLVIDSSGMYSPFRQSLPAGAQITAQPDEDDVFNVYRGIYEQTPDFGELPDNKKFQMFLKYKGRKSISWCGVEPSGELNVLVGVIGKADKEDFKYLYTSLMHENPIIGKVKSGRSATTAIPVRYPLTMFSCNGYTAIGDAAFMTIPIMGSGIENSIRAGQMLSDAVIHDNSVSMQTLWKYQVNYYRSVGAPCFLLDWCKRGLLETDNEQLKHFMECGAVTDDDVKAVMSGSIRLIPASVWLSKPAKFISSHKFINGLLKYIARGVRSTVIAYSIPREYNTDKINKWVNRIEKSMKPVN